MAVYQVLPDCEVLWPDGSVRATAGECFDGFDSLGARAARDLASSMLAGQTDRFIAAPDAPADIRRDMPSDIEEALLFFNGVRLFAPAPKPKAKKKAAKVERLGDPEQ